MQGISRDKLKFLAKKRRPSSPEDETPVLLYFLVEPFSSKP